MASKKGRREYVHKIRIEGEKEYKQSLQEIRRELTVQKSALRENQTAYADNGNSQEALSSRLRLLTQQFDLQQQEVKTLDEMLGKTEKTFGANSKEAADLRVKLNNAKAAMNTTGNELRQLRKNLDTVTDSADDSGDAIDDMSDNFDQAGESAQGMSGTVDQLAEKLAGLPTEFLGGFAGGVITVKSLVEGFKQTLDIGNETRQAQNDMAALTGASGEELDKLNEAAETILKKGIVGSIGEATTATATVHQNMGYVGDDLVTATTNAVTLADTFDMDVNEVTRTAQQLMRNFSIDSDTAFGIIAYGAQRGANKNGDLLDVLNEYAPMYETTGKSVDEFITSLVEGSKDGIFSVDKIGDAWKEFSLRVTDGSDGTKKALKYLGFDADDVAYKIAQGGPAADLATQQIVTALNNIDDPLKQKELAVALFGTQIEDTGIGVLDVFEDMEGAAIDSKGVLEDLGNVKWDDLDTELNKLKARLQETFSPATAGVTELVINTVRGTNNILDGKTTSLQDLANMQDAGGHKVTDDLYAQSMGGQLYNWWDDLLTKWGLRDTNKKDAAKQEIQAAADELIAAPKEATSAAPGTEPTKKVNWWELQVEQMGVRDQEAKATAKEEVKDAADELVAVPSEAMMPEGGEGGMQQVGSDAWTSLGTGVEAAAPEVEQTTEQVSESWLDRLKRNLGYKDNAPSTKTDPIGQSLDRGLIYGVQQLQPEVDEAAEGLGEGSSDATASALDIEGGRSGVYVAFGDNVGSSFASGIRSQGRAAYNAGAYLAEQAKRGTKAASQIASPSKAFRWLGEMDGEGYAQGHERMAERVRASGEAMAGWGIEGAQRAAMRGAASAQTQAADAAIDYDRLSGAVVDAFARSGIAVQFGEYTVGHVIEPSVSRNARERAGATIKGRSNRLR